MLKKWHPTLLELRDGFYAPRNPDGSRIWIGPDSWLQDVSSLRLSRVSSTEVIVSCPDDPQIMFPPPEVWMKVDPQKCKRCTLPAGRFIVRRGTSTPEAVCDHCWMVKDSIRNDSTEISRGHFITESVMES